MNYLLDITPRKLFVCDNLPDVSIDRTKLFIANCAVEYLNRATRTEYLKKSTKEEFELATDLDKISGQIIYWKDCYISTYSYSHQSQPLDNDYAPRFTKTNDDFGVVAAGRSYHKRVARLGRTTKGIFYSKPCGPLDDLLFVVLLTVRLGENAYLVSSAPCSIISTSEDSPKVISSDRQTIYFYVHIAFGNMFVNKLDELSS